MLAILVWLLNTCLLVFLWTLRAKCVLSLICNSAVLWYKMEVLGIESSGPLNMYKCVPVSSEGGIWWGTVAQAVSCFPCQLTFALALLSLSNMSGAIVQGSFRDDYFYLFLFEGCQFCKHSMSCFHHNFFCCYWYSFIILLICGQRSYRVASLCDLLTWQCVY